MKKRGSSHALSISGASTFEIDSGGCSIVLPNKEQNGTRDLGDLETIDAPGHNAPRPELEDLSDDDLLDAVQNPSNDDPVRVKDNQVRDGNGRIKEMRRRGFAGSTKIPVDDLGADAPIGPLRDF